jgi:rhomboid protease GluP
MIRPEVEPEPELPPPAPAPDAPSEAFLARVRKQPIATRVLLAAIALVFVVEIVLGGSEAMPVLSRLGGLSRERVLAGEVWRLVSCSFLHAGPMHVMLNGWVLLVLGQNLEKLLGTWRFVLLYLAATIGGSLLTLATSDAIITVGASGGLFGLLAAEAVFVFTRRGDVLPPAVRAAQQRAALTNLLINVANSFMPHVSWTAHAGGAIVGALFMLAGFGPAASATDVDDAPLFVRALGVLSALVLAAGLASGLVLAHPFALLAGPTLERRDIPALGWSAELPSDLAQEPVTQGAPYAEIVFGDIASDPALVALMRVPRSEPSTPESDAAQLAEIDDALAANAPDNGHLEGGVEHLTVNGRPASRARYVYDSGVVESRLFVPEEGHLVRVDTLVWPDYEPAYRDVGVRVAESIRSLF